MKDVSIGSETHRLEEVAVMDLMLNEDLEGLVEQIEEVLETNLGRSSGPVRGLIGGDNLTGHGFSSLSLKRPLEGELHELQLLCREGSPPCREVRRLFGGKSEQQLMLSALTDLEEADQKERSFPSNLGSEQSLGKMHLHGVLFWRRTSRSLRASSVSSLKTPLGQ